MAAILVLLLRLLLIGVLFGFLGWTIFTLWRDLRFQSQILLAKVIPPISLISDQDSVTENFSFSKSEFTVGRDPTSDIRIMDEIISSRHCRIYFRNSHWWVEDMLSTNGTYLNEERLETATILISGDEVRFGSSTFKIEIQTVE
jgi:pSer/pThr/pTyr-binding forkhead associated (FHA) protein